MNKYAIPLLVIFSTYTFKKDIAYSANENPDFYYNIGISYYDRGMISEAISA
ncbi:MAG: hypothetical protein ACE5KZ_14370 [Candidatus Scalinduaceae bacterium]